MEDKTDTHAYGMNVKPKEPDMITIEVKEVPIESRPLIEYDASKKYLLQAGRTVLQKFRDFTLKPDAPHLDETYIEDNPFTKPICRTQIPIYQEDIERMRPQVTYEEPKFITTQKLIAKLNGIYESLPDRETAVETFQQHFCTLRDWTERRIVGSYEKARDLIYGLRKREEPSQESENK